MKHVTLPGGEVVPSMGQGTWKMGERAERRSDEIASLRAGVELGMTLVDTAEMYGDGAAEVLICEALGDRRDELFLVSKAYPQNASRSRLTGACEASLKRLGTDRLDLYLLHWRGSVPLAETVEAMKALKSAGKIRHWGVSNLDTNDMDELVAAGGDGCVTDQILYNLVRRGPELDLLPWLAEHKVPVMAYSPVEQGRLSSHPALEKIAAEVGATPACIITRNAACDLSFTVTSLPPWGDRKGVQWLKAALENRFELKSQCIGTGVDAAGSRGIWFRVRASSYDDPRRTVG